MKISAVVLTKNNFTKLEKCLTSLRFCDEILLIDDNSENEILKITNKYHAKLFVRKLKKNFASQRNYGLKKARNDWVLFVDADEVVTQDLASEIRSLDIKNNKAYKIIRKNYIFGKLINHGDFKNDIVIRLVKRGSGKWVRKVHEYWLTNAHTTVLLGHLIHNSHKDIAQYVDKLIFYTKTHASENARERKRVNLFIIIFKPVGKFFYLYFGKLGILDGSEGFILAILSSFHSFASWSQYYLRKNY